MIIYVLYAVVGLISYFFVIKPLTEMIRLKLQFGKDCKISFNFFGKEIFDQIKETKESKNERDIFNKQKKAFNKYQYKFFITNMLWKIRISIADPSYQKEALINHQLYQKVDPVCHNDLLSKGLVWSKGEQWKKQRLLLSSSFEFDSLKKKVPMIQKIQIQIQSQMRLLKVNQRIFQIKIFYHPCSLSLVLLQLRVFLVFKQIKFTQTTQNYKLKLLIRMIQIYMNCYFFMNLLYNE